MCRQASNKAGALTTTFTKHMRARTHTHVHSVTHVLCTTTHYDTRYYIHPPPPPPIHTPFKFPAVPTLRVLTSEYERKEKKEGRRNAIKL